MATTAASLKKKDFIRFKGEVWQISFVEFYHPGKGRTVVRTRLKNVNSGRSQAQVFTSNDSVEALDVLAVPVQYLFKSGDSASFMNEKTYEQYEVANYLVKQFVDLLKEGQAMFLLMLDDKAVGVRPPKRVELKVIKADEAVKGDTATNAKKQVTLETGAKVMVPLFIKKGEIIAINPETREYVERVN
jgi:elongation factor P